MPCTSLHTQENRTVLLSHNLLAKLTSETTISRRAEQTRRAPYWFRTLIMTFKRHVYNLINDEIYLDVYSFSFYC